MNRLATVVAFIVTLSASPAQAGVVVNPDPREPTIRLDGRDQSGGHNSNPVAAPNVPAPEQRPPEMWELTECRVDAVVGNYGCRVDEPAEAPEAEEPELTPGDVLRAVREIGLPSLQVQVQPGGETLVNVDTIFYASPQPFERSVTLLGFDVDIVAEPASYQWFHGDGTVRSTTQPGRPYPAMDVTHRYRAPANDVQARVDVTYQVRYRVDGGAWQPLGQTLLATGPAAVLDVKDAAPVLAKP